MPGRRQLFRWALGSATTLALGWSETARAAERFLQPPDDRWLNTLAARTQKAFLDVASFDPGGAPFHRAVALQTALVSAHGVPESEVGIAFGVHSGAIAYLLSAEVWQANDVASLVAAGLAPDAAAALRARGAAAASLGADGVHQLQELGIAVLACQNTLMRWARGFASTTTSSPEQMFALLLRQLHPGVIPVPAMSAAAVRAQSRGVGYLALG